jgi:sulfite exporter TauE/SafE
MISTLLLALGTGLLSTLHCWGMCGSLIAALHSGAPAAGLPASARHRLTALYHGGRIACYSMMGAAGGSVLPLPVSANATAYRVLQSLAALALVLAGLRLAGWRRGSWLEALGLRLWRYIAPLTRRLWPIDRPWRALLSGLLWGLLPCGLVYAMLPVAAATGSAANGALTLLAFGLGTLPGMLGASLLANRLTPALSQRGVRRTAGAALVVTALVWWTLQGLNAAHHHHDASDPHSQHVHPGP